MPPAPARRGDFSRLFLGACVAILLARQVWLALFGELNIDEFENLQVLWLLDRGVAPFRDYEHSHLPVYNLVLAPLHRLAGPVVALPGLVRVALFPVLLLTLWLVGRLAREMAGAREVPWIAVALLLAAPRNGVFLAEARPDTLAAPLSLAAVWCHVAYARGGARRPHLLSLGGLAWGAALVFSQKPLPLALALAWATERHSYAAARLALRKRAGRMLLFAVFLAAPFWAVVAALLAAGWIAPEDLRILFSSGLEPASTVFQRASKPIVLQGILLPNVVLLILCAAAVVRSRFWWSGSVRREFGFLRTAAGAYTVLSAVVFVLLTFLNGQMFILPLIAWSLLGAWELSRRRIGWTAAVILFSLLVGHTVEAYRFPTREAQIRQFRFLLDEVPADRPILDVHTGLGAFHPIVGKYLYYRPGIVEDSYYAPQHREVARALAERRFGAIVDRWGLLRLAPAEVREAIIRGYAPSSWPDVLLPRPVSPMTSPEP